MADTTETPTIPLVSSDEPPSPDADTDETPLGADPKDAPAVIDTTPAEDTIYDAPEPEDDQAGDILVEESKQKKATAGSKQKEPDAAAKKEGGKRKKSNGNGDKKSPKTHEGKKGSASAGSPKMRIQPAGGGGGGGGYPVTPPKGDDRRNSRNSDDAETGYGGERDELLSSERQQNVVYRTVYKVVNVDEDSPAKPCCDIFCGTVCCLVMTAISTAIPIAMIVMGAIHIHDCAAERFIPIYNVVGGSVGILSLLVHAAFNVPKYKTKGMKKDRALPFFLTFLNMLIALFSLAWFIAGTIWVYGTRGEWSDDPLITATYCEPSLYYFSFWMITIIYVIGGIVLAGFLLSCLITGCMVVCCDK